MALNLLEVSIPVRICKAKYFENVAPVLDFKVTGKARMYFVKGFRGLIQFSTMVESEFSKEYCTDTGLYPPSLMRISFFAIAVSRAFEKLILKVGFSGALVKRVLNEMPLNLM